VAAGRRSRLFDARDARKRGVIAFSSGNHAQGVAYAGASSMGCPPSSSCPADAPRLKIDNTRALGAEVITYDRASEDRDALGDRLALERGLTLIKPFDNPYVIAGQGTVGLEIAEQAAAEGVTEADVLVCCGGGGLTSGIALALEARAPGLRARPVEPEAFDDVTRSLASGQIERNNGPEAGFCDAILTPAPGEMTFAVMQRLCGPGIVVTEDQVRSAMRHAFERLKVVAEPGGAVALAAALFHGDALEDGPVIATISGGNVDRSVFAEVLAEG
jgi:threonine dehydratase